MLRCDLGRTSKKKINRISNNYLMKKENDQYSVNPKSFNILIPFETWKTWKFCHTKLWMCYWKIQSVEYLNEPQKSIACVCEFARIHGMVSKKLSPINVKLDRFGYVCASLCVLSDSKYDNVRTWLIVTYFGLLFGAFNMNKIDFFREETICHNYIFFC